MSKWMVFTLCASMLLAACTPQVEVPTSQEIPSVVAEALPPEVAQNILNQISQLLGVPVESIQVQTVEKTEWPDSCLGLGQANESCLQAMTPGWLLVFNIDGQELRFRANDTGTVVRQEQ